ncbi:hypothetical protein V8E51_016308 [Hyaloscypha variabilis]
MDEATKLVSELQEKLTELDHKVWQYRCNMTSEFEKYAESLLAGVPEDISETVSKTIAESMKGCRSLYPDGARSIESFSTGTGRANGAGQSQSGTVPFTATFRRPSIETKDESPRSPHHEREKEFQGLFTPHYLPLLDSTDRNERRSSPEPPLSPRQDLKGKQKEMEDAEPDTIEVIRSLTSTPEPRPRPEPPRRRNTDSISITSDGSGTATPRSALRRSSTSSKSHSPRRVRFDVMGEEVLPTASPRPFQPIIPDEIATRAYPDSDKEAGSEQIEDVDSPPPKRISSSQRLRALSRSPLADDGTEWTTVSAPPDGSASVESNGFRGSDDEDELLEIGKSKSKMSPLPTTTSTISKKLSPSPFEEGGGGVPIDSKEIDNTEEEQAETFSDDEMLDMPPLRRQSASPASMLSPAIPADISGNKSPTASTRSPGKPLHSLETTGSIPQTEGSQFSAEEYDHDDLFHFDDGDDDDADDQKAPPIALKEEVDDSSEVSESPADESPVSPLKEPVNLSEYSASPAREIVRPPRGSKSEETPSSMGIVGSYKGRVFSLPIVSPEVHAIAASMGDVHSFVGSVHGRTGLDESDDQAFRASFKNSGTPRSLSERMRMEDIMEAEEQKRR